MIGGCLHTTLPSADPRIFGPPTWECLHILAQNYPAQAVDKQLRKRWRTFLFTLSYLLPCSHCGTHFRLFLRANSLRDALRGKANLVKFLVEAHNSVTSQTRPGQPAYAAACAEGHYAYMCPKNLPLAGLWVSDTNAADRHPMMMMSFASVLQEARS